MRSLLREPKRPYDGEGEKDEEDTPPVVVRLRARCRVCLGTGRIHLIRPVKDVGRGRRCPACRGTGFAPKEQT